MTPGVEYWPAAEDPWDRQLEAIAADLQEVLALDTAVALASQAAQLAESSRDAVESLQHQHVVTELLTRQAAGLSLGESHGQPSQTDR
jgi:hypothetical protein